MKQLSAEKPQSNVYIAYLIIFILLFFLCLLFPYTGDDWAWGSQIGTDRLSTWFDNYSGRYFGNLIVLALTRSNFLKALAMSFCDTGIIVLINRLTQNQKNGVFIISAILVFMPSTLLRQAVVWTSGFANYTVSVFLTLIYIYYINNIYGEKKPKNSIAAVIPLAVLGFANTLIVEHLTVYNIILSVYVIIFTFVKFKKIFVQHAAYFAGSIAGTALMFSNSVYRSIANGNDGYRSFGGNGGIVAKAANAYLDTIVKDGFINNFVLNAFLAAVCIIIWYSVKKKVSEKTAKVGSVCTAVITAFAAGSMIISAANITELRILKYAEGAATAAYIISFAVFLLILPFEANKKAKLFFIFGSTGCLIAPLFIVTPIGSRCFFAPYVMMIYLGMELYGCFENDIKAKCAEISKAAAVAASVGLIYLFCIYGTITICNNDRIEKAQADAKSGSSPVQIEELPYKKYLWCSDVKDEIWAQRFKLFYDIDESTEIEQIAYKQKTQR